MGPRRNWEAARDKLDLEGSCRRCGAVTGLECAHVLGREHDRNEPIFYRPWKQWTVAPERILPLCSHCHRLQHDGRISIEALLTVDEAVQAVADARGIEAARVRLTPRSMRDSASRMDPATGAYREAS